MARADGVYWHDVISAAGWAVPVAETEWPTIPISRRAADFSSFTQARFLFYQGGSGIAGCLLYPKYSTDSGGTWNSLDGGTGLELNFQTAATLKASGWVTLVAGAKAEIWLALFGRLGNASITPTAAAVCVEVR